MKKMMPFALLMLAFMGSALMNPIAAQDAKKEMKAFAKAWEDAYNEGNTTVLTGMYTDEATSVNATDGTTKTITRKERRDEFIKTFKESKEKISVKVVGAETLPDGQVKLTGTYSGSSVNKKSGEKTKWSGSFEHIAVKQKGKWKLTQTKNMNDGTDAAQ